MATNDENERLKQNTTELELALAEQRRAQDALREETRVLELLNRILPF